MFMWCHMCWMYKLPLVDVDQDIQAPICWRCSGTGTWPGSEVSDVPVAAGVRAYERHGRIREPRPDVCSGVGWHLALSRTSSVTGKRGRQEHFCVRYGSKLTTCCLKKCVGLRKEPFDLTCTLSAIPGSVYNALFCRSKQSPRQFKK